MLRPCLILFVALLFSTGLASPGQSAQSVQSLAQDKPVERQMAGGEVHSYQITLVAGQYLHAVVDQRGIDVVVTLFTPDGRKIAEVDSPNGTQGSEPLWVIATITGTHRLEIRSLEKTATAGRYEVRIVEKRRATLQDKNRIAAEQSFKDGEQLREKADTDSLRNSIVKYEQALKQFRMAADQAGQLKSLSSTAAAHNSLSDRKKAIDTYNQALKLLRTGKERRQTVAKAKKGANQSTSQPNQPTSQDAYAEANLLFNIAADYYALEESEKAL
ncbi:MAG TPA: hypothetical protein VLR90_22330, partial [Blastocatellia bacterium]|nr:hypothetical protein [Blastocatellia bacterium]